MSIAYTETITLTDKQVASLRRMAEHPVLMFAPYGEGWTRYGMSSKQIGADWWILWHWGFIEAARCQGYWDITAKGSQLFNDLNAPPALPAEPPAWLQQLEDGSWTWR